MSLTSILEKSHCHALHFSKRMKPGSTVEPLSIEVGYVEELHAYFKQTLDLWTPGSIARFEDYLGLLEAGPGQGHELFNWLAEEATLDQLKWFLQQESAGEAGFGDLVALTLVGMPLQPKMEMASNFWDEMGNGHRNNVHDLLLRNLMSFLDCPPTITTTCREPLMLANYMTAIALNRRFAYHSVGALGVIEMTAPGRVTKIDEALTRLNVPKEYRVYFKLHGTLDIKHSQCWNREVIEPLWNQHGQEMMLGAFTRLSIGSLCFATYCEHFGI